MSQASFISIKVLHEVDSSSLGFDGQDLKRIARCDDGNDYAMKRVEDNPLLPLTEWVSYHLFKKCGVLVPDCAILERDGLPPAFGSRLIQNNNQIDPSPDAYSVSTFFKNHHQELASIYPLDAFLPNSDRHGRNLILQKSVVKDNILAIDFSRSWITNGLPFGATSVLENSQTSNWWGFFHKNLGIQPNFTSLDKITNELDDSWLLSIINSAPDEWRIGLNINDINSFWINNRVERVKFAKQWTQ